MLDFKKYFDDAGNPIVEDEKERTLIEDFNKLDDDTQRHLVKLVTCLANKKRCVC